MATNAKSTGTIQPGRIRKLGPFEVGQKVVRRRTGQPLGTITMLGLNPDDIECANLDNGKTYALKDLEPAITILDVTHTETREG